MWTHLACANRSHPTWAHHLHVPWRMLAPYRNTNPNIEIKPERKNKKKNTLEKTNKIPTPIHIQNPRSRL